MSMMTRYGVEGVDWTREARTKEKRTIEDSHLAIPVVLILNNIWNVDQEFHSWRQVGLPTVRFMSDQGLRQSRIEGHSIYAFQGCKLCAKDYTPTEYVNSLVYTGG